MREQERNSNNLVNLIKANPGVRVVPLVLSDCAPLGEAGSWLADLGVSSLEEIYIDEAGEKIYFRGRDYEGLVDEIMDGCGAIKMSIEEADTIVAGYAWEKVIIIDIVPYKG